MIEVEHIQPYTVMGIKPYEVNHPGILITYAGVSHEIYVDEVDGSLKYIKEVKR